MHRFYTSIILLILLLTSSCKNKGITDMPSFCKWINQSSNGLTQTKNINDLKLAVKYLPPEYLAMKEAVDFNNNASPALYDSLLQLYKKNTTFILTISPENSEGGDVMYRDVFDYKEYKQRVHDLNFDFTSYVSIESGEKLFPAELSNLENTYSLSKERNIYVVFSDSVLLGSKDIDFIFNDEIFNTGISHFTFQTENLKNIPEITIYKN